MRGQGGHWVGRCGTPEERFWRKVVKGDGCWTWVAAMDTRGYGRFGLGGGRLVAAHRFAYELAYGPIPEGDGYHGTVVMHICDNPACVRPDHLKAGTQADNMRDKKEKGRARRSKQDRAA